MTADAPPPGASAHHVVIHGHFYQPPREDPWLELVPREPSAAPDHDWNARITRECYAPLSRGRVLDAAGNIARVVNAFAWCSFDVGPTLMHWFDRHAPDVRDAIIAGDRESMARAGAGNALAMPYDHVILPLASRRDKVTEVRWGVRDFRRRFGRDPEGFWLPETAADEETLQVLAEAGLRFTVLAPHQIDPLPRRGRAGRWRGAGGRELAIFAYDGEAAHDVAFGDALGDASRWAERLAARAETTDALVLAIATDGETFGHHHQWGDLALAALIDRCSAGTPFVLTNFAAMLRAFPPVEPVRIVSPSSWSCPHGIERWRSEDGCRFDPASSQRWRAPLRRGLDELAAGVDGVIERDWPAAAGDLHALRDTAGPDLGDARHVAVDARRLLAASRHALAMFVSCAWFFDDFGRLEPAIALRHAARALSLLPRRDAVTLEAALLATIATARSSDPAKGDGAAIWRRDVLPSSEGPARLAAGLSAIRELSPAALDDLRMPVHDWQLDGDDIVLRHRQIGDRSRWHVEPVTHGVVATRVHVRGVPDGPAVICAAADFPEPARRILLDLAAPLVFEATLNQPEIRALESGAMSAADARALALRGAWRLVERDGVDAFTVVHAALDLFDLDAAHLAADQLSDAEARLAATPPSAARDALLLRIPGLAPAAP